MSELPPSRDAVHAAFVVDSDAFGGAEVYTRRLLRSMPAWVRRSLVVSTDVAGHFAGRVPNDVSTTVVPLARHSSDAPAVRAALSELAPDVVQVNLVDPGSNLACLRAALDQAPTVATLHLDGAGDFAGGGTGYGRLACALAPSGPIARQFIDLGVPPERVVRIRHGVEIPARAVEVRDRWPLVLGAIGRLTAQKGFDLLIDAVGELVRRGRDIRLLIAGDGRDAAALLRRATGLPVRFLGGVGDAGSVLRQIDVFCLPSRHEALSLALLEAVSHGVPSVTTAVGDTVEALQGVVEIVPPDDPHALADALDAVVLDPALRRGLGRGARQRAVRDFDVHRMAAETAQVLANAVTTEPSRRPGPLRTEHAGR
jgi:glycosyltransferase involved in cell wall biosynthesis